MLLRVVSEDDVCFYELEEEEYERLKDLSRAFEYGEWPDEINEILDAHTPLVAHATLVTMSGMESLTEYDCEDFDPDNEPPF